MKKLTVIIPAKNEQKRFLYPLLKLQHFLANKLEESEYEIIMVVNNSSDNTYRMIKGVKKILNTNNLKVLNYPFTAGKGEAILRGYQRAKGEYIAFLDADGAYSPQELWRFFNHLKAEKHLSAVIADRCNNRSIVHQKLSLKRNLFSNFFRMLTKALFQLPYDDTQGGLKIFRRTALQGTTPGITSKGWLFDLDLLTLLHNNQALIDPLPVTVNNPGDSTLHIPRAIYNVTIGLAKLWIRHEWLKFNKFMSNILYKK